MTNTVTLNSLTPSALSITKNPSTPVCAGASVLLTAGGGGQYSWSIGGTGGVITVYPTTNTSYTLYGLESTCQTSVSTAVAVGVNTPGTLTAYKSPTTTVCPGAQVILSANGGSNYTWTSNTGGGPWAGSPVNVYPTSNTTYTLTGSE